MKKITLSFTLFLLLFGFTKAQTLTYKDVAPIFYKRCTSCHHTGAHMFPFMNYTQTNLSKTLIQFDLSNNIMPPWKADTTYTRFQHERLISAPEKAMILNWIATGATKGDTTQAPAAPSYPAKYQLVGNSDLDLVIPTYTSTATTGDIYVCFSVPSNLTQDRIIRAFEVVPGNPAILHHAVITADTTGAYTSDLSGVCINIPGNLSLASWAPGSRAVIFPSHGALKTGIRLKAGSKLILQAHYPKGTIGQIDSTRVRFYFYPPGETGVRPMYVTTPLQNWTLPIPANTTQTFTAQYTTPGSVSLYGVFPHSHKIGKSMLLYAHNSPGIDTIPMVRINDWDFEWQDFYLYKKPLKVPAGYALFSKHIFNNTTSNPLAGNPPVNVSAGFATSNEMLFDGVMYMDYQTGDENIDLEAIILTDTLLANNVKPNGLPSVNVKAMAFPNPFNNDVTIRYAINTASPIKIIFTDVLGKQIAVYDQGKKERGSHEFIWNSKNKNGQTLPNGVYFYTLKAGDQTFKDKIIKQD
ncbi:MAG: T9SS type A sorting domain-containing protein [Sphingobacteriaceae bacterium]|nr:T9SS type A sorting domain-containing protein [Sphingobacteriaceae bacterium]